MLQMQTAAAAADAAGDGGNTGKQRTWTVKRKALAMVSVMTVELLAVFFLGVSMLTCKRATFSYIRQSDESLRSYCHIPTNDENYLNAPCLVGQAARLFRAQNIVFAVAGAIGSIFCIVYIYAILQKKITIAFACWIDLIIVHLIIFIMLLISSIKLLDVSNNECGGGYIFCEAIFIIVAVIFFVYLSSFNKSIHGGRRPTINVSK